ncbi:hypothetical protein EUGRSUZ_H03472 [Eucalyptus grandis]|uniref:Uncharacterized protein n=2 Tax=Eucalyptus grandis TaxID=71139 RepID=A0ACC3JUC8_EUCGR|nr:hypothetical protein EUGRSUZ_H03472 [Eucalyptus grandis]
MDRDRVSITIEDDEIWEQRRARLKSLDLITKSPCQAEFKRCVSPLLHDAVKEGEVDKFIEALEKYSAEERVSLSDILNMRGPSGNSFLHVVAGIKNVDILQALLEVVPDKRLAADANYRGDTALHVAARAGRIRSAELLLGCGRTVDMANDAGNTALHEAVKNGDAELTRLLLSRASTSVYQANKEGKCPLYLAVEIGDSKILELLMEAMEENEVPWFRMQGMSPVHGAVVHRRAFINYRKFPINFGSKEDRYNVFGLGSRQNLPHEKIHQVNTLVVEMLKKISKLKRELFDLSGVGGRTPLHLAAYVNYVDGVKFLADEFASSAFEDDEDGYLPIHVARMLGHLEIMKELLRHWPDPEELQSLKEGQNILHIAAKYGRTSVVNYILGDPELEKLINAKDKEGNTPLHVATLEWQTKVLRSLTRDSRVNLKLVNNDNLTALDFVDDLNKFDAPLNEIKTATILICAGAPKSKDKEICRPKGLGPDRFQKPQHLRRLRNVANTRMLVAALIGTMTFAAGFSVPGACNGSESDAGMAMLLNKPMYNVFVICNTVAMYNSIIAVVHLLWAQKNGWDPVRSAIRKSRLPLLIALATMSISFTAGVYVTVSKHTWIAIVTLIVGITSLIRILSLYIGTFFEIWFHRAVMYRHVRLFIREFLPISKSETEGRAERPARLKN